MGSSVFSFPTHSLLFICTQIGGASGHRIRVWVLAEMRYRLGRSCDLLKPSLAASSHEAVSISKRVVRSSRFFSPLLALARVSLIRSQPLPFAVLLDTVRHAAAPQTSASTVSMSRPCTSRRRRVIILWRSRSNHPVLHGQPLAPRLLRSGQLFLLRVFHRLHERHTLISSASTSRIVLLLAAPPSTMFRGEKVVPPLAFHVRHDALLPLIAEEAMQDRWLVEARHNQTADVRYRRGEVGRAALARSSPGAVVAAAGSGVGVEVEARALLRLRLRRCCHGIVEPLKGQTNVDQSAESLGRGFVLGVIEEVSLAGEVRGMPFEDVEIAVVEGARGRWSRIGEEVLGAVVHGAVDVRSSVLRWARGAGCS